MDAILTTPISPKVHARGNRVSLTCEVCSKDFTVDAYYAGTQKTCGVVCAGALRRKVATSVCAWCKEIFQRVPSKLGECCSKICSLRLSGKIRRENPQKIDKICECCSLVFSVRLSEGYRKTCSNACKYEMRRTKKEMVPCPQCGKEKLTFVSQKRKYCSRSCAAKAGKGRLRVGIKYSETCLHCLQEFSTKKGWQRDNKYCSMKCAQENWRINGAPREVPLGTVYQEPSGYRYIKIRRDWTIGKAQRKSTTAWVPEHRVIVEQTLERPLTKDEIVHHRNGKKGDNRIENLQVMTRSEHMALHVKAETIGTLVLSGELEILGHSLEEILELIGK